MRHCARFDANLFQLKGTREPMFFKGNGPGLTGSKCGIQNPGSSFVCPDCTPGRIDCGACCGIDPIDEYFSPEEDSGFDEDIYRGE